MYTITTNSTIKCTLLCKNEYETQCPSRVEYNHMCHTSPFIGERRKACDELLV